MNYSKEEIFQILIDFYNFQVAFDPEVDKEIDFYFNTSINEWISICDLVEPKKLAKYYFELFELKTDYFEFETIFLKGKSKNLGDLCEYLAIHSIKKEINPIILFGKSCKSAAIFKTLKSELLKKGINTNNLKPDTELLPFFRKYGGVLLGIVNKISPGSLTNFEYEENKQTSFGISLILITVFLMIPILYFWSFHWLYFIPIIIGLLLTIIGRNLKPKKYSVGFSTFRELIYDMERKLENKPLSY